MIHLNLPQPALPFTLRQAMVVVLGVMLVLIAVSFGQVVVAEYRLNAQKAQLVHDVAQLKSDNAQLLTTIQYLQTDPAIEKLAREELGWTKPGDTAVIVLRGQPQSTSPPAPAVVAATRDPVWKQWWNVFFGESG